MRLRRQPKVGDFFSNLWKATHADIRLLSNELNFTAWPDSACFSGATILQKVDLSAICTNVPAVQIKSQAELKSVKPVRHKSAFCSRVVHLD